MKATIRIILGLLLLTSIINCERPNTAKNLRAKNAGQGQTPKTPRDEAPGSLDSDDDVQIDTSAGGFEPAGAGLGDAVKSKFTIKSIQEMTLVFSSIEEAKSEDDLTILTAIELKEIFKDIDMAKVEKDLGITTVLASGVATEVKNANNPKESFICASYDLANPQNILQEGKNGITYVSPADADTSYIAEMEVANLTDDSYESKTKIQVITKDDIKVFTSREVTVIAEVKDQSYLLVQKVKCDQEEKCLRIFEFNKITK